MKNSFYLVLLSLSFFIFSSCEKSTDNKVPVNTIQTIKKEKLSGYVQKGPFLNGTSITVSELNADMSQTGKTFSSQIIDNKGTFELRNLELSSQFVELKADGFFFNEVKGENSAARLTLYALSDLTDKSTLNVNILSTLEKSRVDYLIAEGSSFDHAKSLAQSEILDIFEMGKNAMEQSESLDISKDGDDNGILLAISLILQGYNTVAELSELLANFSTDIREDGTLDSDILGSALINSAKMLNLSQIRENLEKRYNELGVQATIPDFEKYVQQFIKNTDFEFTNYYRYPEFSDYGENILYGDKTVFNAYTFYSLAAFVPEGGILGIRISGGRWVLEISPEGPVNWKIQPYDFDIREQMFSTINSGTLSDLKIQFEGPSYYQDSANINQPPQPTVITIEYFENTFPVPTRIKEITINPSDSL